MNIEEIVIRCAAEAYDVDAASITPDTNIREELSNQSMKMIIFMSGIEDELNVTIEIREAAELNTIRDFVNKAKALL